MADTSRILPEITDLSAPTWTSGEDGVLRFAVCEDCRTLIHPPRPACGQCRSLRIDTAEVSGLARLIGFSVDHHTRLPGLPSPIVIGQVALAEDERVRLTTRIVDADPDQLRLGQEMRVAFEQVEDVWLPHFTPTGTTELTDLPADPVTPGDFAAQVRPRLPGRKFEEEAAITGIGMSEVGRRLMRDPLSLAVDAALAAIEDAGLTVDDIDGLSTYPGGPAAGGYSEGGVTALESALRIRPSWINGGGEVPGPGGSVIAAMSAVATGQARHVLVFRTLWQATHAALMKTGQIAPPAMGRVTGPMEWTAPFGAPGVVPLLGMTAQRYLHTYGATRETLGWIALNQRANAALNPTAVYRDPLTMEDYLGARMIATPFGLYDCDVPCDASIAVVVSHVDAARDLRHPPIRFESVGTQILERLEWDQSTLTHEPQVLGQSAHLWSRSALRPDDVDVALLYDGFTFNCLSWIEALGFCGIGEAKEFLDGGKNIARDGLLPLNTHGGQLSHGRTHGMGLLHEAVTQLRGDAGERQVPDAEVAVVSSGGLTPSGVMLLTVDS